MNNFFNTDSVTGEEYKDFIWERKNMFFGGEAQLPDAEMELTRDLSVIYVKKEFTDEELCKLPYYSIPKCYTLLNDEKEEKYQIQYLQTVPGLELSGENIVIGVIDTGIEYTNKVFRNLDGSTRILGIWDQTLQSDKSPEGLLYGTEFQREEIDAALRTEEPDKLIPTGDTNGHGTYVTSIAAGSAVEEEEFVGIAPEAEIAVVKLKPAKQYLKKFYRIREDALCYQENDILTAVFYLKRLAERKNKPLVVCMALGTNMGGHTGASPLERYMEEIGRRLYTAITVGSGNEADKRHHFMGKITSEEGVNMEISVGKANEGFCMEIWIDIPDVFAVSITSPTGQEIKHIPVWEEKKEYRFLFEKTEVDVVYKVMVRNTNSELIYLRFTNPVAGIWSVRVKPVKLAGGEFHAWLPVEKFTGSEVIFLHSDPDYTIMAPGNAKTLATAAFYDGKENSIAVNSGRGYTRNKLIKPDFAAPGIGVRGMDARGNIVIRSGSSPSTGITAGAEVLLMEWLVGQGAEPDSQQVKNLLILGAQRGSGFLYPNTKWGYGRLDLFSTFEQIRKL